MSMTLFLLSLGKKFEKAMFCNVRDPKEFSPNLLIVTEIQSPLSTEEQSIVVSVLSEPRNERRCAVLILSGTFCGPP